MIAARDLSTGSVVAWDGEFRFFENCHPTLPDPKNVKAAAAIGAAFSLGVLPPCITLRMDEEGKAETCVTFDISAIREYGRFGGGVGPGMTLVLFGPGVALPDKVMQICRMCPASRVLVSPMKESTLAAVGVIADDLLREGKDAPRFIPLDESVEDLLEAPGQDLDVTLGSDGIGRMAYLMREGMSVCNQTMRRPGISVFHGRVLSVLGWWSRPVFLMRSMAADYYFPTEPLSARLYAATGVPVRVKATEKFKEDTRWVSDEVDIFVSSEHVKGLTTMLNVVSLSSGRRWVASSDPKDVAIPKSIPLFRHNRAYNVNSDLWCRMVMQ